MIEQWIPEDEMVWRFLDIIDVNALAVLETELEKVLPLEEVEAVANRIDDEFRCRVETDLSSEIFEYVVEESETDEATGTWGYFLISFSDQEDLKSAERKYEKLIGRIAVDLIRELKLNGGLEKPRG